MISLEDAVIARISSHGHHFEILVDPVLAHSLREGENVSLDEVVAARTVFKDSAKGEHASEDVLKEAFQSTDFNTIALKIIKKGEIQLTTEQRHQMQKEKKKQIINIICRESIDPRTKAPHTPTRVERALEEAKVHVDPFKPAQRQVEEILKKLSPVLPIRFAKARIAIRVPAEHAGRAYGFIHDLHRLKEEWASDGSLNAVVEIPAGMQTEIYDKMNALTHGSVETRLIETV
ncbi:MAG: ribosome assembly factor SBDS [Candidatus Diapherotrites archaeon]|nr:ribosome assembly factor SBDS [Candidatus Diapherotrites archaeon]